MPARGRVFAALQGLLPAHSRPWCAAQNMGLGCYGLNGRICLFGLAHSQKQLRSGFRPKQTWCSTWFGPPSPSSYGLERTFVANLFPRHSYIKAVSGHSVEKFAP